MAFDLYQEVTDQIIGMLEQGVVPWRSPILGQTYAGQPKNLASGKPYRGINVFLLAFTGWEKGYGSGYWLTFNQAKARGGAIRKGEKSSMVVFWKPFETTDKETGELVTVPVLRYYNVFNVEQCSDITAPDMPVVEAEEFRPIEAAAAIAAGYADGPTVEHGGSQAFYAAKTDSVRLPEPSRFFPAEGYYATLFHELAHSTGHSRRLDRGLDSDPQPFGSPDYGKEELVAESAAAFLCATAGIRPIVIENQAAYIQGWLKTLEADKRLVISAAGAGQRAADWILGKREPAAI